MSSLFPRFEVKMLLLFASIVCGCLIHFVASGNIVPVNSSIACGENQPLIVTAKLGLVSSPNFDNFHYYPPNSRCSWIFQAPEGQIISFKTLAFGMNRNCDHDAVEFHEGRPGNWKLVDQFCGFYARSRYQSKTNLLQLTFRSGPVPSYTGFQFFFEHAYPIVQCKENEISCRHQTKCVEASRKCDGVDDCKDGTDEENCEGTALWSDCGIPTISPSLEYNFRIVGGRVAVPGSWPWQVSLRMLDYAPFSHMCGGALINRQWIMSAAHCFKNKMDAKLWNVLLGKHFKLIPDQTEELRYIESIYIHPEYKGFEAKMSSPWLEKKQHDIALLKLNAPVFLNDYIVPVCLPKRNTTLEPGSVCYVTGWGDTYGSGFELELKQAALPILTKEVCRKMHFLYPIADTMICAGYHDGGHDSCQGDSGGPLVFKEGTNRWTSYGIVSTGGSICAEANQPGIYTSVPHYLDWIYNITGFHEDD